MPDIPILPVRCTQTGSIVEIQKLPGIRLPHQQSTDAAGALHAAVKRILLLRDNIPLQLVFASDGLAVAAAHGLQQAGICEIVVAEGLFITGFGELSGMFFLTHAFTR